MQIRNRIIVELVKRGIPRNLFGFHLLVDATEMAYNDMGLLHMRMTKELYPEVGKLYEVSGSAVERAIRYAVSRSGVKMNNSIYIAELVIDLKMEDAENGLHQL